MKFCTSRAGTSGRTTATTPPMAKRRSPKRSPAPGRCLELESWRKRPTWWKTNYVPVGDTPSTTHCTGPIKGPTKGQKKNSRFLFICSAFPEIGKYRSRLQNCLLFSQAISRFWRNAYVLAPTRPLILWKQNVARYRLVQAIYIWVSHERMPHAVDTERHIF